jgi:hypothetical protein
MGAARNLPPQAVPEGLASPARAGGGGVKLDCTPDRAIEHLEYRAVDPSVVKTARGLIEREEALHAEFRQAQAYLDEVRWGDGEQTGRGE